MECNKEEAIRSRNIAEQKFLLHDLMGAKKFVLKAQNLFPGLEGLPQLLAVLDVHIVAQNKVDGVDPDWYGILQTHAAADEATIRKQYRKLALNLHPDKNKAVGAEGAFMLISEAWGVLSDKFKKAAHDARRKHEGRPADGFCNFTNFSTPKWPQPKPGKRAPSLWIKCPSCQVEVQCARALEGNMVICSICHQIFAESETYKANVDPYYQGRENTKSKGKTNVVSNSEEQAHGLKGSCTYGSASSGFEPEGPIKGASTSSYCGPDDLNYTYEKNVRHGQRDDVQAAQHVFQQQSAQKTDSMSPSLPNQNGPNVSGSCAQTRSTNNHLNFQCHWESHMNRTPSNHPPAAMKATAEMVQNVFDTVRRERVKAQREAREKAIEAEKEARRQKHRQRHEQKQRRKDEDLKKQAKAALYAKKAFDKLFAREQTSLRKDINSISKASFECESDGHGAGVVNTNHQAGLGNTNSLADLADC